MTYEETIAKLLQDCPDISLDKLRRVRKVITHGGKCADGRASAMILNAAFGGDVPIEFVVHGTKEHRDLKPEPGLLFCDFCPESDVDAFLEVGTIVLDHHRKVKDTVLRFVRAGQGAFADEKEHPGVSGATLAYEYVWQRFQGVHTPLREVGRLAGIRDTWQTKSSDWTRACEQAEALSWWPEENLLNTPIDGWSKLLEVGPVLWAKKLKTAQKVGDGAHLWTSKAGTRVAIFQGMRMSSDVAEYLHEEVDLVIGYDLLFEDSEFKQGFSTRSHTHYNCMAFAQAHGGGGHTKAAGFGVPLKLRSAPNPFVVAKIIVDAYEGNPWARFRKWFL